MTIKTVTYHSCPFCEAEDFDKPGLAYHLDAYCPEIQKARDEFQEEQNESLRKYKERKNAKNNGE